MIKYALTHTDDNIAELLKNSSLDVVRLSLRDYTSAINRGEAHTEAFEYIEYRFVRYNKNLIKGLSIVTVE